MHILFVVKPFIIPPLGIMSLSAIAKQYGHRVELVTTAEDIDKKIAQFKPDYLAYSILTGDQDYFDNINKELKKKYGIKSIVGNAHPTYFPEWFKQSSFDTACIGEGETTFIDFLSNPRDGALPLSPLIDNLDSLPIPDRSLIYDTYPQMRDEPIRHFMFARGCRYSCFYCYSCAYRKLYKNHKKPVRYRSVDSAVQEIKDVLAAYPAKFVYIQDDTYNGNKDFLREFADKYAAEIGLPFHCHVRLNLINEEVVNLLSRAGCTGVHAAIESGNETVRRKTLNRYMSDECIINGIELLKKHNIKVMTQQILGISGTTLEDDLKTLELNIKCKPDYAWASIFVPYPRTVLGERCVKEGVYTGDFSDIGSSFFDTSPLNIPHKNEVANLQKLFAIAVENPDLYHNGILLQWIKMPYEETREQFTLAYKEFRKEADRRLYGIKL